MPWEIILGLANLGLVALAVYCTAHHFKKTRASSLMGRKLFFLGITALVVLVESLLDIVLILKIAPGSLVSCCTTVTDILERPTRLVPKSILGPGASGTLCSDGSGRLAPFSRVR